jgi:DNA-binding Lrp family transcriptional regulator
MIAFVLIQACGKDAQKALAKIKAIKGVKELHIVTGPYDAIAKVEIKRIEDLGPLVLGKIRTLNGICTTITCLSV